MTVPSGAVVGGAQDEAGDQRRPARLVAGADAPAGVTVEALVEGLRLCQSRWVWKRPASPKTGRRPFSSSRKIETRRRARSSARTVRVTLRPEPAGCSMRMSSLKNRA